MRARSGVRACVCMCDCVCLHVGLCVCERMFVCVCARARSHTHALKLCMQREKEEGFIAIRTTPVSALARVIVTRVCVCGIISNSSFNRHALNFWVLILQSMYSYVTFRESEERFT